MQPGWEPARWDGEGLASNVVGVFGCPRRARLVSEVKHILAE